MSAAEMAALDAALAFAEDAAAPRASQALQSRILADFEAQERSVSARSFTFKGAWRLIPAGALAALTALGFFVGAATAQPSETQSFDADTAIADAFGAGATDWTEI